MRTPRSPEGEGQLAVGERLLLDENAMHSDWVRPLAPLFNDVQTMQSLGRTGLTDEEQLEFAAAQGWTIFTFDTGDFARLHWE